MSHLVTPIDHSLVEMCKGKITRRVSLIDIPINKLKKKKKKVKKKKVKKALFIIILCKHD